MKVVAAMTVQIVGAHAHQEVVEIINRIRGPFY